MDHIISRSGCYVRTKRNYKSTSKCNPMPGIDLIQNHYISIKVLESAINWNFTCLNFVNFQGALLRGWQRPTCLLQRNHFGSKSDSKCFLFA